MKGGPNVNKLVKLLATFTILLGFISGATISAQAEDGGSYESNGKVSFYGEWKPKDDDKDGGGTTNPPKVKGDDEDEPKVTPTPTPKVEVEGDGTNNPPRTSIGADEVAYTNTPKNAKIDGTLPQTGMSPYVTYAGIALLLLGHLFLLKRRRRDSNNA